MDLKTTTLFCLILYNCIVVFVTCLEEEAKAVYYSEDYYNYYDSEYEDTESTVIPPTTTVTEEKQDPEFKGQVTCSNTQMMLEISKTLLPAGLGFTESLSEDLAAKGDFGPITCVRVTHNKTHYIYKVALDCQRAVGKLLYETTTIYTHEFLLHDISSPKSSKKSSQIYSVIIDCETPLNQSNPQRWMPQYRIFEHRKGRECSVESCPHADLCLPRRDIKGYFCSCPRLEKACACPEDFYECSLGDGISRTTSKSVICVGNDQLCDTRYDCPLQDDENCADEWKVWGDWSQCSTSCGEGTQVRQRSCVHAFTKDISRSSQECTGTETTDSETRSCDNKGCSSVECGSEEMSIEIPFEFGMTAESAVERMHLKTAKDQDECQPVVNATHVKFVIPLHKCGTANWVDGDIVIYTNVVEYEIEDQESSIIVREFGHSYTAKCQYKRRHTVSMQRLGSGTSYHEIASLKFEERSAGMNRDAERLDVISHYSSGDGEFEYRMDIFRDSSYTTSYEKEDYPLEKRLGERLYIGVNFKSQDEDLHVFIERCWASSSDENGAGFDDAVYLFINGGCPSDKTVQFHNGNDSQFSDRYSIESFKFNDAQFWYIYFRCDVILCDASEDDPACRRECNTGSIETPTTSQRRKRSASASEHTYRQVMQGPIVILGNDDIIDSNWRSKVSAGSVEHKVITFEEVNRRRAFDNQDQRTKNIWESPYLAAGIVGIICLVIGIVFGLILKRRNTPTKSKETHL